MPFPFDAALKELAQISPGDLLAEIAWPADGPVRVLNVDLSAVSASGDFVLGIGDPLQYIVSVEFQAGPDAALAQRVLLYNALVHYRYGVPVHSVVVLLRPKAESPALDGSIRYQARAGRGHMDFGFEIVRLWQRPAEALLSGSLATLPLAPLGQLPAGSSPGEALPAIIRRIEERLSQDATPEAAAKLMRATFVLTGMVVAKATLQNLFAGVRFMQESSAYDVLVEEGEVKALRETLLRQGRKRFKSADESIAASVNTITDLDRLKRMTERLLEVTTWQELLSTR